MVIGDVLLINVLIVKVCLHENLCLCISCAQKCLYIMCVLFGIVMVRNVSICHICSSHKVPLSEGRVEDDGSLTCRYYINEHILCFGFWLYDMQHYTHSSLGTHKLKLSRLEIQWRGRDD